MRNIMLPLIVIIPLILFSVAGNAGETRGEPEQIASAESKQKPRSLNIPKQKGPLRTSKYKCEDALTFALVKIDPAYLQTKLGDSLVEVIPSMFKYRLSLVDSEISPWEKDYVICRYGVHHGKINDLRYRRFCRDASKDPASGTHAYKCAE